MSDAQAPPQDQRGELDRLTITVVTPVYNCAELLEDCIVSVLGQDYPNLEYIIVDGGSTDGTVDVLRRYEDRLTFWISEPDDGQADALNKGFRRATGEIACWLNADDFFYPGALAAAREAYLADPRAPFYFGNGYRVDREGHKLAEFFPEGRVGFRRDALLFGLNCVLQPSTFIRRDALEEVGLVDASLHYGFDTDLWIRLSTLGRPRPIGKHLAASREYGETKTATGSFRRAEELRRIAEQYAKVPATPGSVCYYLDTLHRLASSRPDVFPPEYLAAVKSFWSATAQLFSNYGARPDGFPIDEGPELENAAPRANDGRTRVGVELRHVTRGASGGIVVVLIGTLHELSRRRPDLDFVVFCTVFNHELLAFDFPNVKLITLPLHNYFPELTRIAREYEIDVLLRSYPTVDEVDFPLERQIFLLPDVQHEYHPEFFDAQTLRARKHAFGAALGGAGAIMTISEYARGTIKERAGPDCDVFVAAPSLPPEFLAARSDDATHEERTALPTGDFFFFPANLWPHKNHERLFDALRSFRARTGSTVELVLTGAPSGWDELRSRYADLPIKHLGYVSPALMRLIYERALALTFFSQYEGFGIPLLEAFEAGTPVLCSNATSLPEVAGDAALMCDPTNVEAMSTLMERVAGDPALRSELVELGRQRLAAYSWQTAADALAGGAKRLLERLKSPDLSPEPLVSIVTPSYNHGHFLRRTIESVLAQTYPNIEYIVIDGGSTDETLNVLRSYGDRIRWLSEPDSGQTNAINKGFGLARGELMGYLNSDDVLATPEAITKVVEYLRDHPSCDLVYGDADYIDEDGNVTGTYPTAPYSFDRLLEDCCICQPAAYWRGRAAEEIGLFDERLDYAMDYDYWLRLDRSGFIIRHMPETIAQSRLHSTAKTLVARHAIYREIFDVCRLRAGYISRSYVDGYWHYLVYERWDGSARALAHLPKLRALLVSLHHRWLNRRRYMRREVIATSVRSARRRLVTRLRRKPRLFVMLLSVRNRLRWLLARGGRASMPSLLPAGGDGCLRVSGYWPDNWVANRLEVVVDPREQSQKLLLVGRPVTGMTLEVSTSGKQLGEFELVRNGRETVSVWLPPGPRETVTYAFSDHSVDAAGRPISFLLEETNLFREEDLHALA
jgi:glycosyltransferase involved in cell wall biosynthesis